MRRYLFCLMLSSAVISLNPVRAMNDCVDQEMQNKLILQIPENFPGHNSKLIQGTVKIPDYFDPAHYQQHRSRNEGACVFNSMLAGIMHTEYGRSKLQTLLISQDDSYVNIQFYFPEYNVVKEFEDAYYNERMKLFNRLLPKYTKQLEDELGRNEQNETKIQNLRERINQLNDNLRTQPILWEKALHASPTAVKVLKNFITRGDKASFPHDNPEWLNLIQQA